jgi:hypothetical protein
LAGFCSIYKDAVTENQNDFNNTDFISVDLLTEDQIQSQINSIADSFDSSISIKMNFYLNYLMITSDANELVSALNTNFVISIFKYGEQTAFDLVNH